MTDDSRRLSEERDLALVKEALVGTLEPMVTAEYLLLQALQDEERGHHLSDAQLAAISPLLERMAACNQSEVEPGEIHGMIRVAAQCSNSVAHVIEEAATMIRPTSDERTMIRESQARLRQSEETIKIVMLRRAIREQSPLVTAQPEDQTSRK